MTATVNKSIQTTSAYSRQLVGGEAHLCALYLANWQYDCVGGLQRNYGQEDKRRQLVQEENCDSVYSTVVLAMKI